MKIAICDDESIVISILKNIVLQWLEENKKDYTMMTFESGTQLLDSVFDFDVIFLDINMPLMDGIETGIRIRKVNEKCKIIMATSQEDRIKESIKINIFRFLTKPFQIEEIKEALEAIYQRQIGKEKIVLYDKRIPYEIEQRRIEYMITYDSYSEFCVKGKLFRKDISLKELENLLEAKIFYQVDRKVIINMHYIKINENGTLKIGEQEFSIARRRKKDFQKRYMEFDLNIR